MTAAPYPSELESDVDTDVWTVRVRPIRTGDGPALIAFHEGLSAQSQYLRFFHAHPHLSPAEVERFTHVDYDRRLALVIEFEGALIAVGRYDRLEGDEAEVAFVVADRYQNHGLGALLLQRLAEAGRARGLARFVAETLAGNQRMLGVFRESGFGARSTFDGDVVRVSFPIGGPGPSGAPDASVAVAGDAVAGDGRRPLPERPGGPSAGS